MATESQEAPEEPSTKIIISGTNGEVLHEEPSEQTKDSDQESAEPGAELNGPKDGTDKDEEPLSKPVISIEEYLDKHKIKVIFEELISRTLEKTPEYPLKFLHSSLEKMEEEKWEPGESFSEKADAVHKVFHIQGKETDKIIPITRGTRPGSGGLRGGPPGKVGTNAVKGPGPKTTSTPVKSSNPPKSAPPSIRPTPVRTTTSQTKTGPGTRPVPITTKTPAKTTTPPKTAPTGRTGTTGGATKTGPNPSTTRAPTTRTTTTGPGRTTTTATTGRTGTTGGATKTGSNTSLTKAPITKTPATKPTPAGGPTRPGPRTVVPTTGTRGATGPKGPVRTTSGARSTAKTGTLGTGPRTKSGQLGKTGPGGKKLKDETPVIPEPDVDPEPKAPTPPAEGAAAPGSPEEEPQPKIPVEDGLWSQIPGSEETDGAGPDSDDLLAKQEIQYDSEDEPLKLPNTSIPPLIDTLAATEATENLESVVSEGHRNTSLQGIEDEAELNVRQSAELNELADEGIDVDPETLFTPRLETGNEKIYSSEEMVSSGQDVPFPGIPSIQSASERKNILESPDEQDGIGGNILESPPDEQKLDLGESHLAQDSSPDLTTEIQRDVQPDLVSSDDVIIHSPILPKLDSTQDAPTLVSIEQSFQNAIHSPTNLSPNEFDENLPPSNQSPIEQDETLIPLPSSQPPNEQDETLIPLPTSQPPNEQDETLIPLPTSQPPNEQDETLIPLPTSQLPNEQDETLIPLPTSQLPNEQDETLIPLPTSQPPNEQDETLIPLPSSQLPNEQDETLIPLPTNQSPNELGANPFSSKEPTLSTIDLFEAQIQTSKLPPTSQSPPPPSNPFVNSAPDTNTQAPGMGDDY